MDKTPGDLQIKLTSLCNRIGIPANEQPQPVYLLTQLIPNPEGMRDRMPLNVAVILDHSSPAMTEGLPVFKQALKDLVEQLQPTDHFSLVSLTGPVIIPARPVIEKARLKRLIDKVAMTAQALAAGGFAEGLRQVLANRSADSTNRILLILAGEIETKSGELESLADQTDSAGIPVSVIGFGSRWDDALWTGPADCSLNGMVEYAPSVDDIAEIMQRVYRSMHVLGRDVRITLRFIRGVELRQVWRVAPFIQCQDPPSAPEQVVSLYDAELSQDGIAYLVEAILPPRAAGQVRIAQTEVVHRSVENLEIHHNVDLVVEFSQDMGGTNPLDCYVMNFVEMAQARRLNLAAMAEMNAGNRQAAIQKFRQAAAILVSQGHTSLADCIRGEADYNIRQYGQISGEGRKLILFTGRRLTSPEKD